MSYKEGESLESPEYGTPCSTRVTPEMESDHDLEEQYKTGY